MEKHMQLLITIFSKSLIMQTIHCMNLNSTTHRLNRKNQSFWDSSFLNLQNHKNWNCTKTFPPNSVTWTCSKSWKWTQILCVLLLPKRKGRLSRTWNENRVGSIMVKRMQWEFYCLCIWNFRPPNVLWETQKTRREPGLFKEEFWCTEMFCLCRKT